MLIGILIVFIQQISSGFELTSTKNAANLKFGQIYIKYEEVNDPACLSLFNLARKCIEIYCEDTKVETAIVLFQQMSTGCTSNTSENVITPEPCVDEIEYELVVDPEFLSVFQQAEKCMENVCEETQIKSVTEICQPKSNVTPSQSTPKLLDVILIAGVTSVGILAIAAIVIVGIRKRRSRVRKPPNVENMLTEMKQQSVRQGCLRPLPTPEEPRYSYMEVLEVPKMNRTLINVSQTNITADYLEPVQIPNKNTCIPPGAVRRRLASSNPDDHDYQEIQTYEVIK